MSMQKRAFLAKCESFCASNNYATAKLAYDRFYKEWDDANEALERFVKAQGPNAHHANGLTADYVKAMPEYRRLSATAYEKGEACKAFNSVYTRVFKREHIATIQAQREAKARDHSARWAALCATV